MTYRRRELGPVLAAALRSMPVVVLTGLRQSGKTTLLRNQPELRGRRFVSFEDFAQLDAARRDPEGFLAGDDPLTIDEAHKFPEILTVVKRLVDRGRKPGRFLLSGSANFALLRTIGESLAGRAVYLTLHPFTRREIAGTLDAAPFLRRFFDHPKLPSSVGMAPIRPADVAAGGMPLVCLGETEDVTFWFKGYEQTYLECDVRALSQVGDLVAFRNLMKLAALRTAQVLNQSQLGRDAGLNAATTGRYLALMEASYLLARTPPFLSNRASRLIKSPKVHVTDSAIAASLAAGGPVDPNEPLWGALLETYVAQNVRALLDAAWSRASLCYWSVQGRYEVDLVVESGRDSLAIEVKAGSRWRDSDLAGLEAFLAATPRCRAAVLAHNGRDAVRLGDRLWALPLGLVLS